VLSLLEKTGLEDSSSPANYRLISNLPTVSKVLKRLALIRLLDSTSQSINQSINQSFICSVNTSNSCHRIVSSSNQTSQGDWSSVGDHLSSKIINYYSIIKYVAYTGLNSPLFRINNANFLVFTNRRRRHMMMTTTTTMIAATTTIATTTPTMTGTDKPELPD